MRYYVVAGERSGDLHASNLITALREEDPEAMFFGMGGDLAEAAGLQLSLHYQELAVMGFWEVLKGLPKVYRCLRLIKKDIRVRKPQKVILVDYGGFNMKIAKFCKGEGIPVHYYIPPKIWAWNRSRAHKLKRYVSAVYCILPFEADFFREYGIPTHYIGNPLRDEIAKFSPHPFFYQKNELGYRPIIALLPGSREQEVRNMLDIMLALLPEFSEFQFLIAGVDNLPRTLYAKAEAAGIRVLYNQTYDILHHASAAVVTSGTATLEVALFRVPQVVVYRTSPLSYAIAKRLIRVPYISLVNLISGEETVKELIQEDFNPIALKKYLMEALHPMKKQGMLAGYAQISEKIGFQDASKEAARLITASPT
ncbi:lipid-A-disaccharide synthase [Nitritalea halalkaliphila]|nr:lipid-A-disaccharide synthase [Nitritalea halalkaliphila]